MIDPRACYRAVKAKDERFDGRIFVGVKSTGIYCRPVCPATPARFSNCRFYPSAAAAQDGGFRPCLRCRPETVAELGAWCGTSNTVSRGLSLIAEGALDQSGDVEGLADRLGVSGRHLRRLFQAHLGASPVVVAQTRRVLFAKQLIHETRLPMTDVALAAGFGSVRRFNETFRGLFRRPPTALRREAGGSAERGGDEVAAVTVHLRYRPPFDWDSLLEFLEARAIAGVERVEKGVYSRTLVVDGRPGSVRIAHAPKKQALAVTLRVPSVRSVSSVVTRVRRVFDLTADTSVIESHLAKDPVLRRLVTRRPGLRVPGGWESYELAVRAVVGQQVTVIGARAILGRLCELYGERTSPEVTGDDELRLTFPEPRTVARVDLRPLRITESRKRSLCALSEAAASHSDLFEAGATVEETIARLRALPGIGPWTAATIALRASREPDAFPAGDAGLLRSFGGTGASRNAQSALDRRAEQWRPWRGYAAQHLWAEDAASRRAR